MRIGLNLLAVRAEERTGIESYVRNVVGELRFSPNARVDIALRRSVDKEATLGARFFSDNPGARATRWVTGGTAMRIVVEMLLLSVVFFRCDRVLSINNFGPLFGKRSQRRVVIIHDVWFLSDTYAGGSIARVLFKLLLNLQLRFTQQIITISEMSKRAIIETLNVAPGRIVIAPPCLEDDYGEGIVVGGGKTVRPGRDYWLLIGSDRKNKNVSRAMEGYAAYVAAEVRPIALIVVGSYGVAYTELLRQRFSSAIEGMVCFKGYVTRGELWALIRGARGIVYPSLYEGYGIPVIEAISAGKPVLVSKGTVCEEIAGPMAVAVNGRDVNDLAQGYRRLAAFDATCIGVDVDAVRERIVDCKTSARRLGEALEGR